jgi:hypothetical protein
MNPAVARLRAARRAGAAWGQRKWQAAIDILAEAGFTMDEITAFVREGQRLNRTSTARALRRR